MAFKNPSIIQSGISIEEFEDLKKKVENIEHEIQNIKGLIVSDNSNGYSIINLNIINAKLRGVPRVTYVYLKKPGNTNGENIVNEICKDNMSKDEIIEEIPDILPSEKIISIDEILEYGKEYKKIEEDKIPTHARVTTGMHRTFIINSVNKQRQILPNAS